MSKFIKVTPRGEQQSKIVLASLKNFYLSQGAKIEIPTDAEVYAAEPTERPVAKVPAQPSVDPAVVKQLRKGEAYLKARIAERDATIAELREKLAASETALKEAEALAANLRAELAAKPRSEAKEAAE